MSQAVDFVAVGGGPAALAAVRAYREAAGDGTVGLITDENRVPYRRPALTKELLRGETTEADLGLEEEFWFWREGVRLIYGRAVTLDPHARHVVLAGGRIVNYRTCVIATGAEPSRPHVPGIDDPAVLVLRSIDELRHLRRRLEQAGEVAVVGSGFIGCEIAASLQARGHQVNLISDERAPNRGRLGAHASAVIDTWLRRTGVRVTLDATISAIERRDGELHVVSDNGHVRAPLVVLATGVDARSQILRDPRLVCPSGAISVDSSMCTPVPGLLAAGDVALAYNRAAERPVRVAHWRDAIRQGEIAGHVAAGKPDTWNEVPGFWTAIAGHTLKYAGWGDGYDACRVQRVDASDRFSVWYERDHKVVGVLAHNEDAAYDRGIAMIQAGAGWAE